MDGTQASAAARQANGGTDFPWLRSYPAGIDWAQTFKPAPLHTYLDAAVRTHGSRLATHFLGKTLTYAEIGRQVEAATAGLQRLGVKKGTKVGLLLPNTPTFLVYYYATLKAGGVVVNFNPLYTLEELQFQVRDSQTEMMVTLDLKLLFDKVEALLSDGTLKRAIVASFTGLLPGTKSVLFKLFKGRDLAHPTRSIARDKIVLEADVRADVGAPRPVEINAQDDLAVLQYTGGTTGTPKGAMLTHANVSINVQQAAAWLASGNETEDRVMGILPFFHVFAMTTVMNLAIAKAAQIIMMPRFVLLDALKLITETKPTLMPGVPTLYNAMLNHPKIKSYDLSSLRACFSGGAPLPLEVKRGFEAMTGCRLIEGYGLSETSPVATGNPLSGLVKSGSIGQPVPGTTISIRAVDDPATEVPLGAEGEICIKGPQVMKGYWQRPEDTANAFVDGFFRSGDVGKMDEDGFIYITDRIKDMIICSGFKVFPRHVEEKIYEHPAVEEVTVIGIADKYRGEAPKAFIKLKAGSAATQADIMRHLEPRLSKIEMPAKIEFRDALPKTMIGKLSKKELKQEEAQRQPG